MANQNENDKQLLEAFKSHEHFCKALLDAFALVSPSGKVIKCNQWLTTLVGKKSRAILKADNFDDLLPLSFMGRQLPIAELLQTRSVNRLDEVGATVHRDPEVGEEDLNLIVSIYPFMQDEQVLGIFLLIRDVTAETNLQAKYKEKAKDKLTGLFNRGYFNQYFPAAIASAESSETPDKDALSVIMSDIDHFKRVNDEYGGHAAGDYVLERVAKLFKEKFRKTDVMCRYGGEEFVVVLPGTTADGARLAAEKLREAVEQEVFIYKDEIEIPVTISLGIAQLKVGNETGQEAIERADSALYKAKHSGRNQVRVHRGDNIID
ncbi:MAG: sensor domain-containing diguanylate cyclase [Zetaproteobacteria bacterium]|nr:sensor domain-containing diguanylate cyclase [Zetaproteobacteria bacterium]